jgi:hypothetical protein
MLLMHDFIIHLGEIGSSDFGWSRTPATVALKLAGVAMR